MKIAYLVNTYPRASHTFIRREVQALERLGFAVHRFAMRSDRAALVDPDDLAEDDRTEHVLHIGAPALALSALRWMAAHPVAALHAGGLALHLGAQGAGGRLRHLIYLAEAAHVAARCKSLGVQHLHAHFGTNSATVALLCRALGGPEYSFTVHGPEEFDAPKALSLAEKVHHARFAVAISSFGRGQLYRWVRYADWGKVSVVHCGIEPDRFPTPAPLPDAPRLVAIGRFSEQKGFPLLIEAMALAAPLYPDLHLTLVGDGELRPEIEALIARHGLAQQITLTGWLPEAAVRAELARSAALILPSFAEGLPMVVMEAMASARPVIATAIAGVPELVTPDCGWLVPSGDAAALAEAITTFCEATPEERKIMGQNGRQRVLARHDINQIATRLAGLIRGNHD